MDALDRIIEHFELSRKTTPSEIAKFYVNSKPGKPNYFVLAHPSLPILVEFFYDPKVQFGVDDVKIIKGEKYLVDVDEDPDSVIYVHLTERVHDGGATEKDLWDMFKDFLRAAAKRGNYLEWKYLVKSPLTGENINDVTVGMINGLMDTLHIRNLDAVTTQHSKSIEIRQTGVMGVPGMDLPKGWSDAIPMFESTLSDEGPIYDGAWMTVKGAAAVYERDFDWLIDNIIFAEDLDCIGCSEWTREKGCTIDGPGCPFTAEPTVFMPDYEVVRDAWDRWREMWIGIIRDVLQETGVADQVADAIERPDPKPRPDMWSALKPCSTCGGAGYDAVLNQTCKRCGGTGKN